MAEKDVATKIALVKDVERAKLIVQIKNVREARERRARMLRGGDTSTYTHDSTGAGLDLVEARLERALKRLEEQRQQPKPKPRRLWRTNRRRWNDG
jgi:hypothetical protein